MNKQEVLDIINKVLILGEEIDKETFEIFFYSIKGTGISMDIEFEYDETKSSKENLVNVLKSRIEFYFRVYRGE